MALGPIQILVVGFDRPDFSGEVLAELERLRESDVVRVIDLLVVHKGADGIVRRLHHSDLTAGEAEAAGAVVGALIGLGATSVEAEGGHLPAEDEYLVSRRGHPERLRRRDRARRAPLGDRHPRRDPRRGRRCGRRRMAPSGRPRRRRPHRRRRRGGAEWVTRSPGRSPPRSSWRQLATAAPRNAPGRQLHLRLFRQRHVPRDGMARRGVVVEATGGPRTLPRSASRHEEQRAPFQADRSLQAIAVVGASPPGARANRPGQASRAVARLLPLGDDDQERTSKSAGHRPGDRVSREPSMASKSS